MRSSRGKAPLRMTLVASDEILTSHNKLLRMTLVASDEILTSHNKLLRMTD
jgi:hypothetical protein